MSFVSPPEQRPDARPDGAGKSDEDHRSAIEFFIDRSLGRKHLAQALGDLGFTHRDNSSPRFCGSLTP
jgi:hypothetical protein